MANKIHEEDIKLNLIINGDKGQQELHKLQKNTSELIKVENELKKAKSDTKKELDKLNSTYGVNAKVIDNLEKSKNDLLNKYNIEVEKLKEVERQHGKSSDAYKKLKKETTSLLNESIRVENQWGKLIDKNQELAPKVDKLKTEYKSFGDRLNNVSSTIASNKERMKQLQDSIGLTSLTMQQLRQRASQLRYSLNTSIPGTEQWKKLNAELAETNARIKQLNTTGQQQSLTFSSASGWLQRYQTHILSIVATITGLTYSLQKWIDFSAKLSDAEADVMKTTGLTATEIQKLNKHINDLDTRTSRVELLKLAEEAGRLGKEGIKDIQGFMVVADKLKVALGDDLNETQIRDVGKLVTTYRVATETGKNFEGSMEALGSAINEVSASGANQASFLVDYMNRMAGVASQAKISASDNIGYAATFDEIGQSAEVASTAMNKVLLDMFHDPTEYAKIAKMSLQDFNKLLNTDSNAAMIKFLEGLNGSEAGLQAMTKKMDELDAGGTRGVAALSALASNLDILKARQLTSNIAMQEATSLTDEFTIKNNNLAALLDKIKNKFQGWFSSDSLVSFLTACVAWFAKLIGATEDNTVSTVKWRTILLTLLKVFIVITTTIISYATALKLVSIWQARNTEKTLLYNTVLRINNGLTILSSIGTKALTAAKMLLNLQISALIVKIRAMTAAMWASPWGPIAAAVTLLSSVYFLFTNNTEEATEKQIQLNDSLKDLDKTVNDSIIKTKENITRLINIIKDENISLETRKKAYQDLIKIAPEFNGYLEQEKFNIDGLTRMYDIYINKLYEVARAKAIQDKLTEAVKRQIEADFNLYKTESSDSTLKKDSYLYPGTDDKKNKLRISNTNVKFAEAAKKDADKEVEKINGYINSDLIKTEQAIINADKKMTELVAKYGREKAVKLQEYRELSAIKNTAELKKKNYTSVDDPISEFSPTNSTKKNKPSIKKGGKSEVEKAAEKAKAERDKFYNELKKETEKNEEEILKIQQTYEDISLENIEDKYDRELEILKVGFQRKQSELEAQQIGDETFKILNEQKLKATKEGDTDLIARIDNMKEIYLQKNEEIDLLLLAETHKYSQEKLNIERNRELKTLDNLTKSSNDKLTEQKRLQTAELATISSVEDAKEILKRSLNDKELKNIKTWQDAKTALDKQYEAETLAAQQTFLEEQLSQLQAISQGSLDAGIDFNLLTPEQQEVISQQVEDLKNKINELIIAKNQLKGEQTDKGNPNGEKSEGLQKASGGTTDIFGMNANDWQTLFDNLDEGKLKFEDVANVIGLMVNMYSQYAQMVAASENKSLQKFEENNNKRKDSLQKQLDQGFISQATYNAEVQKLDDAYNKRKAEIEYKQAKREKQMALVSAIMNTAAAVTEALPNWVLAGIVGALGAIQVGMILKQPLPSKGFEDGYINIQREQDGKNFRAKKGGVAKSGLVSKPTHFLAGEQGQFFPEMIISGPQWKGFSPALKTAVLNEVNGIKSPGYEGGSMPEIASMQNPEIIALLSANYELLSDLKTNGIQAHLVNDMRFQQKMSDGNKKYQQFISKTKM